MSREPQTALQIDAHRWGGETDNVYLKTRLGLGDCRVRPDETVDQYVATVHLALADVQDRLMHERASGIRNLADVIRHHRDAHPRDWLTGVCPAVLAPGDLAAGLNRFLRLDD